MTQSTSSPALGGGLPPAGEWSEVGSESCSPMALRKGMERTLLMPKKLSPEEFDALDKEHRSQYLETLWNKPRKAGVWGYTDQDLLDNFRMAKPSEYEMFRRIRRAGLSAILAQDAVKPKASYGLARQAPAFLLEDNAGSAAMSGSLKVLKNDLEGALQGCNEALREDATVVRAWRSRGNVRLQTQDFDGALRDTTKVIELSDGHQLPPWDWVARGEARLGLRDFEGAIEDFTKAIELDEKRWRIWWRRAVAKAEVEDLEGAVEDCTQALKYDKEVPEVHITRARAYLELQNFEGAEADFTVAIKYNPTRPDFWFRRAEARAKLKNLKGSAKDIVEALKLDPLNIECWKFSARIAVILKDWPKVESDCNKLLSLDPGIAEAYAQRGEAKIGLRRPAEALLDLDEAARLDPSLPLPSYYAAKGKFQKGLYLEAIDDCKVSLAADPKYKPAILLLKKAEDADRSLKSWKIPGTQLIRTPRRGGQEAFVVVADDDFAPLEEFAFRALGDHSRTAMWPAPPGSAAGSSEKLPESKVRRRHVRASGATNTTAFVLQAALA